MERSSADPVRGTGQARTVCFLTNGCPENRIDAARMQEFLKRNDWRPTDDYRDADLIVFNACAHTADSEALSIKITRDLLAKKKPGAEVIVCGCLSRINPECLSEVYHGFTFGSDEVEKLSKVVDTVTDPAESSANYLIPLRGKWRVPNLKGNVGTSYIAKLIYLATMACFHPHSPAINAYNRSVFCIKVSTGCLGACAFCAIRLSRGRVQSKPIPQVMREFEDGLAKGYKEFALIGTDLGAYGRDIGATLADLVRTIEEREGSYTVKIRNINPKFLIEMTPDFCKILESGKVSYLSSALESGSNRILRLMKRGYTVEEYEQSISALRQAWPTINIRTQVMVGFPTESEEDFQDTARLLDKTHFDFVEIYMFQPRPKTVAARLDGQVPRSVARRRMTKLYLGLAIKEARRGLRLSHGSRGI